MFNVAYLVYTFPDSNFMSMVHKLKEAINKEDVVKAAVESHLGDVFAHVIQFMDTKGQAND